MQTQIVDFPILGDGEKEIDTIFVPPFDSIVIVSLTGVPGNNLSFLTS